MSERTTDTTGDLADTRFILEETHRALQEARQRLRQMDKGMTDARSWLALVEGSQQGRVTNTDRESQGETVRSFAAACEEAGEAGFGVDRRISRAVANLKAAVVMLDGLHLGSTREEIEAGRLRRQLVSLQDDLDRTRPGLRGVADRLGTQADHARRSLVRPGRDLPGPDPTVATGSFMAAYRHGRHVDSELERAESLYAISQGALERMRSHHERSQEPPTPPPVAR